MNAESIFSLAGMLVLPGWLLLLPYLLIRAGLTRRLVPAAGEA